MAQRMQLIGPEYHVQNLNTSRYLTFRQRLKGLAYRSCFALCRSCSPPILISSRDEKSGMLWIDPAKLRSWFQGVMARIPIENLYGEDIEKVRHRNPFGWV